MLFADLSCVPTRQGGEKETERVTRATSRSRMPMDFITSLPMSNGFGTIIVVLDRFSNYNTFMPAITGCTTKEVADTLKFTSLKDV